MIWNNENENKNRAAFQWTQRKEFQRIQFHDRPSFRSIFAMMDSNGGFLFDLNRIEMRSWATEIIQMDRWADSLGGDRLISRDGVFTDGVIDCWIFIEPRPSWTSMADVIEVEPETFPKNNQRSWVTSQSIGLSIVCLHRWIGVH